MVGAQNKSRHRVAMTAFGSSGEGGIRTPGRLAPTPVFETGTFGRSVTSPQSVEILSNSGRRFQQEHPSETVLSDESRHSVTKQATK